MVGLAAVFLFVGLHIWMSARIEPWLSALIVAGAALIVALILMLVGQSFIHRSARQRERDVQSLLGGLGVMSRPGADRDKAAAGSETGPAIIGAALAVGVLLGRSFRR
jgi:F0F1-type ATP synthase membrane subunit c/vacuolar-type H+-ATPase subunit K